MRVVFVNRFFPPDHSATSQLLGDLAREVAARGAETWVICSSARIDAPGARLPSRERVDGVEVRRGAASRFGRHRHAGRVADYLAFYLSAIALMWRHVRRGDVLVACTDPPLISVAAAMVAWARGASLVNWLHDLFPEVALRLNVLPPWLGALLVPLRDASLRRARCNVALGARMAQQLDAHASGLRVQIIHNWADDESIVPVSHAENPLREQWGLEGRFVVCYSGNLGRAHEFDGLVSAARALRRRDDIVFLFIGAGHQLEALREAVAREDLRNVQIRAVVPRRRLRESLGVADLHVVSLRPQLEGLIVPSKFYGIAAAGRALLVLGDRSGEVGKAVQAAECGVVCAADDASAIAAAIEALCDTPQRAREMGERARELLERRFTRRQALSRWCEVLEVA